MTALRDADLGAVHLGDGRVRFRVWAPFQREVILRVLGPEDRRISLETKERGYHEATVDDVPPGSLYVFEIAGKGVRPDPASRHQPEGVHGPSRVVDRTFPWHDASWKGTPLERYILYEIHVGTFTEEGTFDGAARGLDGLVDLGITAVELMPVAQFPGTRNWGYDGVFPYAVQDSYGGPDGLRRLVEACHRRGLAVVLDVVYNHLGPEGGCLGDFGPYVSGTRRAPWGPAMNFDGPHSDHVRRYFVENALYWMTDFHVDALRLDAIHAIVDLAPYPFVQELADAVHAQASALGRHAYLIAEDDRNDPRLVRDPRAGGLGLDAQWNEDFHHALHALLTGERFGYYGDFGTFDHLRKAFEDGFVYAGEYSAYRKRRHGLPAHDLPPGRFVVFAQNHDQVGNRLLGDRLARILSLEGLKLSAAAVLLSPYLPLLFMGEEYGERAPFYYFVSHSDPDLIAAVRRGRAEEFRAFAWDGEPADPQDEATFLRSRLDPTLRSRDPHASLLAFYRELIRLRRSHPALQPTDRTNLAVRADPSRNALHLLRRGGGRQVVVTYHFGGNPVRLGTPLLAGRWTRLLDSADARWGGPGSSLPEALESPGEVDVSLRPEACVAWERAGGG